MTEEERQASSVSRRTMLKRIGIAGTVAWVTPVVTSLNTPAFAASEPTRPCDNPGTCDVQGFPVCGSNEFGPASVSSARTGAVSAARTIIAARFRPVTMEAVLPVSLCAIDTCCGAPVCLEICGSTNRSKPAGSQQTGLTAGGLTRGRTSTSTGCTRPTLRSAQRWREPPCPYRRGSGGSFVTRGRSGRADRASAVRRGRPTHQVPDELHAGFGGGQRLDLQIGCRLVSMGDHEADLAWFRDGSRADRFRIDMPHLTGISSVYRLGPSLGEPLAARPLQREVHRIGMQGPPFWVQHGSLIREVSEPRTDEACDERRLPRPRRCR